MAKSAATRMKALAQTNSAARTAGERFERVGHREGGGRRFIAREIVAAQRRTPRRPAGASCSVLRFLAVASSYLLFFEPFFAPLFVVFFETDFFAAIGYLLSMKS
jgi:hypothetical protein